MPEGLLISTQGLWRKFWKSALAGAMEPESDTGAIVRLFTLYDERERAFRAYRRKRLIEGSQGQMVLNPMARAMSVFDAEIRQLEDRLGLTPRARLQLGIQLGEAAKSLQELNRMLDDDHEDSDPRE
jgi:P27 family predicted phage terminase small subunit